MIYALCGLVGFLAVALVVICALALVSAGKERDTRDRERREMFRVLTARIVTDDIAAPGSELRALRILQREMPVEALVGSEAPDPEMNELERERRSRNRAMNDGEIDEQGNAIIPTGLG